MVKSTKDRWTIQKGRLWTQFKSTPHLVIAQMWKEYFEGEGIPSRILPNPIKAAEGEAISYRVLIPSDKEHIIEEVLKRI